MLQFPQHFNTYIFVPPQWIRLMPTFGYDMKSLSIIVGLEMSEGKMRALMQAALDHWAARLIDDSYHRGSRAV